MFFLYLGKHAQKIRVILQRRTRHADMADNERAVTYSEFIARRAALFRGKGIGSTVDGIRQNCKSTVLAVPVAPRFAASGEKLVREKACRDIEQLISSQVIGIQ